MFDDFRIIKKFSDSMDPAQSIVDEHGLHDIEGEISLWTAVIKLALADLTSEDEHLKKDAVDFLDSEYCRELCDKVGYDYDTIVRGCHEKMQ